MSASQTYLTCGLFGSEGAASLGVDVGVAVQGAPSGECLRLDYGADSDLALARDLAFQLLGVLQPCRKGRWKSVRIRHECKDRRIVGFLVPRDADRANLWMKGSANA